MVVEGNEAKRLFSFVTTEDHEKLIRYLRIQETPLDFMNMKDSRKFTILAYAAYRN